MRKIRKSDEEERESETGVERESQTQRNDGARERDVNGDKRDDKAGGRIKLFILGPTFIFSYIKYFSLLFSLSISSACNCKDYSKYLIFLHS